MPAVRNMEQLRKKAEIDYEKCSALLFKLIKQVCDHYENQYGQNGMQNIVMMYKRGVFSTAKFDSMPELVLARVLENDGDVQNWLRPAPREFNITYNRDSHY